MWHLFDVPLHLPRLIHLLSVVKLTPALVIYLFIYPFLQPSHSRFEIFLSFFLFLSSLTAAAEVEQSRASGSMAVYDYVARIDSAAQPTVSGIASGKRETKLTRIAWHDQLVLGI